MALLKSHTVRNAVLELKVNFDYSLLLQSKLSIAPSAHCCHYLGGHFEHLVGSHRRYEKPTPHVIASFLDFVVFEFTAVLLAHHFFITDSCLLTCSSINVECCSGLPSVSNTTLSKAHRIVRI